MLMIFAILLVTMGLTNVNNAATTMGESIKASIPCLSPFFQITPSIILSMSIHFCHHNIAIAKMTDELLDNAELIASNLKKVGDDSISIRDAAVAELDDICPSDPNIADSIGTDIMGIANQAQKDLTMLANFIGAGLEQLNENLVLVREFTDGADDATKAVQFWDWEMKLLAAGLFILPSFLATGVGLVMLGLDVKPYQKSLTYFFTPLFAMTIMASYVVCCAMLPISATTADACSGGGEVRGGPDDTVLTVYRNLVGDDTGTITNDLVGFYTQRCDPKYYPFGFLNEYLNDLDKAIKSTDAAFSVVEDNQGLLEARCGRKFENVITIVEDMNGNLELLKRQASLSLDLINCKDVNSLYVNTVHDAGCTYSVDALAWIFASTLVISVCGMIMIMLRSAYYPEACIKLGDECWGTVAKADGMHRSLPPLMDVPRSIKDATSNDCDEVTKLASDKF